MINKKEGIIVIVATKNRVELLNEALNSVDLQTKKPIDIYVTSDSSNENKIIEKDLCLRYGSNFLENKYTHNYAGNLNTALESIVEKYAFNNQYNLDSLYIAFLDDDDTWQKEYLRECWEAHNENTDIVVSGLNYHLDEGTKELSIPDKLNLEMFLKGNPHIQGSNTFVRLSTILKAGCFDENMDSTTDRDLFTRLLMLNPNVNVVDKHLVEVNASNSRNRLTNDKSGKSLSLAKFYYKYSGLMSDKIKKEFFKRASLFTDIENENRLLKQLVNNFSDSGKKFESDVNNLEVYPRLCFSFITTDINYARRLIQNIYKSDYPLKKMIIFANFESTDTLKELTDILQRTGLENSILTLNEAKNFAENPYFDKFVTDNINKKGSINDIAVARSVLHYYSYINSDINDIVYVLDEDMEFYSLYRKNGKFIKRRASIKGFLSKYLGRADAVIGNYSGDAPIPTFSTLRSNLLDYVYNKKLKKNNFSQDELYFKKDYYYSISDEGNICNETPFPLIEECSLKDVLGGKAISRPLFDSVNEDFVPTRRGGNTLFLNRELLRIPNPSIKIAEHLSRRGDSLWVVLAKKKGFKIIGSSFSLIQNRFAYDFDLEKELKKETLDIMGYAMIDAILKDGFESRSKFYKGFINALKNRTIKFAISYFRIIGLLEILDEKEYSELKNEENIYNFIRKIKELSDESFVNAGFDELRTYISLSDKKEKLKQIENFLINKCFCEEPILLGYGLEGAIYKSNNKTCKVFFNKDNLEFFKSIIEGLNIINGFPKNIVFDDSSEFSYCYYDTLNNVKNYNNGYAKELAVFIDRLRKNGLVIKNFKKENLVISDEKIIYIDLGKDIIPYSEDEYKNSVERCYQMIKYSNLDKHQFKILVSKSYKEKNKPFNYSLDVFNDLIMNKNKEQTHDPIILDLIKKHNPGSILDYGAGKCKIVNSLTGKYNLFVYDIDKETLNKRANRNVNIIEDIDKIERKFDLINCNKVICCVDNNTNEFIMNKINQLLNAGGRLILSICNPFFDNIDHTVTSLKNYSGKYEITSKYLKSTIYGEREEYHRPFNYYERLLNKYGFVIDSIYEDNGIDTSSLSYIGQHLIFNCHKINKTFLNDCSLLIKANAMEANTIYENVKHIVSQLEKNDIFAERILTIDLNDIERARSYTKDDIEKFDIEINRLKDDGYIDKIVSLNLPSDFALYEKYFSLKSKNVHSLNGQGLLATLKGFESCRTRYVFQTDSDIIYFNDGVGSLNNALKVLKNNHALTLSLSIAHKDSNEPVEGSRTEVRTSFIDLKQLNNKLPLYNEIINDTLKETWHRSLDISLEANDSLRTVSNHLFFIHPENELKNKNNLLSFVRSSVENGFVIESQFNEVNLVDSNKRIPTTTKEVVIFIRGRNTPTAKLKRLFDSLKEQSYKDFQIVFIDDNSTNVSSSEYIRTLVNYSPIWKEKVIFIQNEKRIGSLANFDFFYKNICVNSKSIIINIDSDDALIGNNALSLIKEKFDSGNDVTVGNCFRTDKPLKKYNLISFKESWKRNGDNIWLHPKCFRRYLCEFIQDRIKKDNEYIDVATDYAIMLPIVENALSPTFIKEQIYLFDTSIESQNHTGVYKNNSQQKMKKWLLKEAEKLSHYKTIAIIGDGSIKEDSFEYKIALELGKNLAELGYNIKNGGLGGVMEASFKGAKSAKNYRKGSTIAIIPSTDKNEANDYADIVIPTGLDILRNGLVIDADAVIVIGGGAGTLSEIAMAWQKYKLIIAFNNIEGWGSKLAGKRLDNRIRYKNIPEDCVFSASNVNEVIKLITKYINLYTKKYHGIKWRKK